MNQEVSKEIINFLKGSYSTRFDYVDSPGVFEQMVNLANEFVKVLRDNKLTFNECRITVELASKLLEHCFVGNLSDFDNCDNTKSDSCLNRFCKDVSDALQDL